VRANRRIDADRNLWYFLHSNRIERVAHAVKALELILGAVLLSHGQDGGDRARIMAGELRKDMTLGVFAQQKTRTGQKTDIRPFLARVDRVGLHAQYLRVLDFGVPVGPLTSRTGMRSPCLRASAATQHSTGSAGFE